ncbi:hypothetical protein KMI_09g15190 [Encephalitozoon hellem]|nr:hypothetical protein KMI_09g15190 [Encephalitozoon hellem]
MNSNFFNQQNKDDNNQKNPFLNTPFGSQQSTFGNQMNKPSIFGGQSQQTGAFGAQPAGGIFNPTSSTGFGGGGQGFPAQGFLNKQAPSTGFGTQQPQASTSLFGKPGNLQSSGNTSIFGGQSTLQPSENPFKPHAASPSPSSGFGAQQPNNTFGTQFQSQAGSTFGTQLGNANQSSNPFASPIQNPLSAGIRSTQDQGNVESSGMIHGGGFGTLQSASGTQSLGPQVQQAAPSNQQTTNPFSNPAQTISPTLGTQQNTSSPFSSMQESQPQASGIFPSATAPQGSEPTPQGTEARDAVSNRKPRASASVFNQAVGEKGVSFMQMTLGEIIQQQTRKLEENIKVFKEKAKEVFEQDERIIRSLNNYKLIRNRIEEEERVIAETEENVEFFEKWLCNFQEEVPEGAGDELLMCIKEFERVCDKYNKTIETLKDEEDEVMCLVNENYNLITTIEEKLEILEKY